MEMEKKHKSRSLLDVPLQAAILLRQVLGFKLVSSSTELLDDFVKALQFIQEAIGDVEASSLCLVKDMQRVMPAKRIQLPRVLGEIRASKIDKAPRHISLVYASITGFS